MRPCLIANAFFVLTAGAWLLLGCAPVAVEPRPPAATAPLGPTPSASPASPPSPTARPELIVVVGEGVPAYVWKARGGSLLNMAIPPPAAAAASVREAN